MIDQIANINMMLLKELLKNRAFAVEQSRYLAQYLLDKKCTFRGKPFPTSLKPHFISPKQSHILAYSVEKISSVLDKLIALYMRDEEVRRLMGFNEVQNDLFSIDPGYSNPLVITRLDAFMNDYSVKFLEFNCDSPAGMSYTDIVETGFRQILNRFPVLDSWEIEYVSRNQLVLDALITCYDEFRASHTSFPQRPVIAVVDWEGVSTSEEFFILKDFFEERGYGTVITSPQRFRIRRGHMEADGEKVHLIYKRVLTRELAEKLDETEDFVQGIRDGLACTCNPFRTNIVGNKKILAIMTEPRFQDIYDAEEQEVIDRTIPWTTILSKGRLTIDGKTVEVGDFVLENRDNLVLKPASSYGGKDVYVGRETDEATWSRIIKENLESQGWVVQEYVDIPEEIFPSFGDVVSVDLKKLNINPYAFLGKYSGTVSRYSESSIINVSHGGGLAPTMCVRGFETVRDD